MATTEHTLRLKAVLDSKQVQQELQRLRQMQQKQIEQTSTVNAVSKTTNAPVQATGRLDIQIQGLSKNISVLTTAIQRLNSFNTQQSTKVGASTAIIPSSGKLGKSMKEMFANEFDKTLYKSITKYGKALPYESFEHLMRGPLIGPQVVRARTQYLRDIIGPNTSYDEYQRVLRGPDFQALGKPGPKYDKQMMQFAAGMAINQGLGSIAEYMQTSQNQNVSSAGAAIGAVSKVGGYALMGAGVGGVYGAAAGAALGAVESLFDLFTAKAREAQAELDRVWKTEQNLKQGTAEFTRSRIEYTKNKKYETAFDALTEEYDTAPLSKQLEQLTQRREFVRSRLDVLSNMSAEGFLGEADLKSAKEMQQELVELDNKIKASTNALKNYRQAIDNVKEAETYQESTKRLFKSGSLSEIQSAYEQIKAKRDEAMAAGNLSDIQKYTPRMRAYEQQIENIREIQRQSALDLQRMDESYENTRVLERYGYGGGRGLHNTLIDYGRKAASERSRYEQLIKEGKLDEAEKAKQSWQFAAGERNTLADQLLQVLGNRTADLTNVTSLASMGFGMGEKNDNYDRQMKVLEDQRDLQRDIKNILNEKTFAATYGE